MRIDTERADLLLRSWAEADVPQLVEQANDRAVWRNLTHLFPHPYTLKDAQAWILIAQNSAPSLHLCIEHEGAVGGGVGLVVGSGIDAKTGLLGYWLGRKFWGRGLATAAARALIGQARATRELVRLQAAVFEWNPASMRVLEKVGFQREAVLRKSVHKDGKIIDAVLYALILE